MRIQFFNPAVIANWKLDYWKFVNVVFGRPVFSFSPFFKNLLIHKQLGYRASAREQGCYILWAINHRIDCSLLTSSKYGER